MTQREVQPCKRLAAGGFWSFYSRRDGSPSCRRCAVFEELWCEVEQLQEEVRRLHSIIREHEREIGGIFSETKHLEEPWSGDTGTVHPWYNCSAACGESDEWKLPTSGIKSSLLHLKPYNCETGSPQRPSRVRFLSQASGPPHPKPCETTRRSKI